MPAVAVGPTGRRVVIVSDWKGEYGEAGRHQAPLGAFTGRNVVRYRSGRLGPRNGVIEWALTGASSGVVNGLGYNGSAAAAGNKPLWFVQGTAVRLLSATGTIVTPATPLSSAPGKPVQGIEHRTVTYLNNYNDGLYKLDHGAETLTRIASPNSPGGAAFVRYGNRYLSGGGGKAPDGTAAPANRVYYSAANDAENWGAASDGPGGYFDVGDSAGISAMIVQRGHLVICTTDDKWWIVSGTVGVNYDVREALATICPNAPEHVCALGNGLLGYAVGSSSVGSIQSLGMFTGSEVVMVPDIFFGEGRSGTEPTLHAVALKEADDFFVLGGPSNAPNDLALLRDGVWTLHEFGVAGVTMAAFCAGRVTNDAWVITDGGGVGAIPRFFTFRAYNNRPAFASDTLAQPGDDSTTPLNAYFSLPEVWAEDGSEVALRAVTVEFVKWNYGGASTNHFDLTVTPTGKIGAGTAGGSGGGDGTASDTQSFDEAVATAATTGTHDRRTFYFRDQGFAHGFVLDVENLRGCAIEKLWLHIDAEPCRVR